MVVKKEKKTVNEYITNHHYDGDFTTKIIKGISIFLFGLILISAFVSVIDDKSVDIDYNYRMCINKCAKNTNMWNEHPLNFDKTECIKDCNNMLLEFNYEQNKQLVK